MEPILVRKFSGEWVPFDLSKLQQSLINSGANQAMIVKVSEQVKADLVPGKSTQKIYREAFDALKRLSKASAARYNLKRAVMQLGPSGFPFERYVSEIFKNLNYKVDNNVTLNGKCVTHEVDVLAEKNGVIYVVECKFHNRQGLKSDVKIPMYFNSRVRDIIKGNHDKPKFEGKRIKAYLATNTRFSEDAIIYSACEGITLLSWDYPKNQSLKDWIEISGLYPLTSLNSLKQKEKKALLDQGVVLCKSLKYKPELLARFNLSAYRRKNILQELNTLCEI